MVQNGTMRSSATATGKNKKKNNATALKSGIVILMMMVVMVGYYYYLSNKEKAKEENEIVVTVAQELIARDLTNNYPPSPKEVIRYYSDITQCFYNEEYSDEELEQLAIQTRMLYDDELVVNNDWDKYMIELRGDITEFKQSSIKITSYSISASTDVDYFEDNGFEFARLRCTYYLTNGSSGQTVEEVYLLRRDENEHWRIYGWDLAENVHIANGEDAGTGVATE